MNIFDLLYPKSCLGCKRRGQYICSSCLKKVAAAKQICPECRVYSFAGKTHKSCLRPLGFNGVYSVWEYKGVIKQAILALKYRFARNIADELVYAFVREYKRLPLQVGRATLVPVPLHKRRENWRGFNQSELLGREIAEKLGWTFEPKLLIRKRFSTPQTKLKGDKRRKNIRNVFALNTKYKIPACAGRQNTSYILFDDVSTTGSTLKEAGKVLKRAGAKEIWGLTIAS